MSQNDKTVDQFLRELKSMFENNNSNGNGDGRNQPPPPEDGFFGAKLQFVVIVAVVLLYALVTSFYKIEPSQEGVVTRFGAFSGQSEEGPHFMLPFGIDQVYKIEVTRIHELAFGFRQNGRISKTQARLESLMLTGDLNIAVVDWILQYRISDAPKYLFNARNVEKNIRDASMSVMRRVVGDKLVSAVLSKDRVEVAQVAMQLTQEVLDVYDMGVTVTRVQLQNVTPPESVKPSFNDVNIARQEREQKINEANGERNEKIPKARGLAAKQILEAEAYAVRAINRAKGDSDKFKSVLVAYKKAPAITRDRMFLETIEDVFGNSKDLTIVDDKVKGLLPVFASGKSGSSSSVSSLNSNPKKGS